MYHALLTNRYLTSRVIPLIAVAAVAMCVALVIIVVSVMTGFLDMVKSSGRTLMGDVVVSYPISGIPYYERLIDRIKKLPEAAAATPVADGLGLLRMPYPDGPDKKSEMVQFWGIDPVSFADVTGYAGTLHWKELTQEQWIQLFGDVLRKYWKEVLAQLSADQKVQILKHALTDPNDANSIPDEQNILNRMDSLTDDAWEDVLVSLRFDSEVLKQALGDAKWHDLLAHDSRLLDPKEILKQGLTLRNGEGPGDDRMIVMGMHVSEGNERQKDGSYRPMGPGKKWWMPRFEVTLTTIPVAQGASDVQSAESRVLKIANEFVSGVYLIDDKRVMVPISVAQSMLHLDQAQRMDDPDDPFKVTGIQPAHATMVLVRAAAGVTPEILREAVKKAYDDFVNEIIDDPSSRVLPPSQGFGLSIQTWEQQQASFIGPVEKEREMMRVLFSIVYLVCAGLVLSIFWAIVSEKTRDIGILRSVGASREGVLWIFTRYGLMTGSLGSLVGLLLGTVIINRINPIQDALAKPPILLAAISLAPCILAAAWVFVRGGIRSVCWMILNLVAVGAVGAGVFGMMRLMSVDPAIVLGSRWEFVLGGALILILICLFAFVNLIRPGALVATFVGTLVFLLFLAMAILVYCAHTYGGFVMWSPEVYYFTLIPNTPDWRAAWGTVFLAIMFSVLGAAVAAAKAADTDPVQALRYE